MYLTFQVTNGANTEQYLVIYNGRTGGYHPVFVAVVPTTSLPAYPVGAVIQNNNRIYYSYADDRTGELLSDGVYPLSDQANSIPFTKDVAISLGWFDADRDYAPKHFKHWLISTKDFGGGSGQFQIGYQKWNDSGFTEVTGDIKSGTLDNATVTPAPETGLQAGFETSKLMTKITLKNAQASPYNCWYVSSLHVVGRTKYKPAFMATLNVLVDEEALDGNDRGYDAAQVEASVKEALNQVSPVRLTWVDGTEYIGSIEPVPGGDRIVATDFDDSRPRTRTMMVQFIEDK
jgi:hypothetical protein